MIKPINVLRRSIELMLAERSKMLSQERSKLPTVQSLTDKMSRLTNRKLHNPKLLLNELTTGDKNVTFNHNHSTSTARATSSEGKKAFTTGDQKSLITSLALDLDTDNTQNVVIRNLFSFNIGWFFLLFHSAVSSSVFFVVEHFKKNSSNVFSSFSYG